MLSNTEDGTDHVYHLSGAAEKPLALEHIVLKGHVRERCVHSKYTVKFLNFGMPEVFAVIYLKFKQRPNLKGILSKWCK